MNIKYLSWVMKHQGKSLFINGKNAQLNTSCTWKLFYLVHSTFFHYIHEISRLKKIMFSALLALYMFLPCPHIILHLACGKAEAFVLSIPYLVLSTDKFRAMKELCNIIRPTY